MLKSQEIQLAQSKRREKMAAIQKSDEITDDARTELRSLTDAYEGAEVELRAAMLLEEAERDKIKVPDKAETDFSRECRSFSLASVVASIADGRALTGREAEVTAELEQRHGSAKHGVLVPFEAFETRADATVSAPDASSGELASRTTMQALERLFEQSAAQQFGFSTIAVSGQPRFPELTGGASAAWVAEGEGTDAAAITTNVQNPTLRTLTARYKLTRQATKQNSALEPLLRRDLAEVMREAMDLACFRGTGENNQPTGLSSLLSGTAHNGVVTYRDLVDWACDMMAATKSPNMNGISVASAPFVLADLLKSTFGDVLTEFEQARKIIPSMTFSSQVSEVTGDPETAELFVAKPGQHAWVPVWGPVELIVDPYSESKTGHIAITTFMFADVLVQRQATHFKKITGIQRSA